MNEYLVKVNVLAESVTLQPLTAIEVTEIFLQDVATFSDSGVVQISNEFIIYSGRDVGLNKLTGLTRSQFNTTVIGDYNESTLIRQVAETGDDPWTIQGELIDGAGVPADGDYFKLSGDGEFRFPKVDIVPQGDPPLNSLVAINDDAFESTFDEYADIFPSTLSELLDVWSSTDDIEKLDDGSYRTILTSIDLINHISSFPGFYRAKGLVALRDTPSFTKSDPLNTANKIRNYVTEVLETYTIDYLTKKKDFLNA